MSKDLIRQSSFLSSGDFRSFFDDYFFSKSDFKVDITDAKESINLKAELPGVKKEDISVDLQDGILTLKAEKKVEIDDSDEKFLRKETQYGSMQRSFTVGDVDVENIEASFSDGILKVILKKNDPTFKKIEIQ